MITLSNNFIRAIVRNKGRAKNKKEEITVVACSGCKKTFERRFLAGDHVFGPAVEDAGPSSQAGGACSTCGSTMFIKQIFTRAPDSD